MGSSTLETLHKVKTSEQRTKVFFNPVAVRNTRVESKEYHKLVIGLGTQKCCPKKFFYFSVIAKMIFCKYERKDKFMTSYIQISRLLRFYDIKISENRMSHFSLRTNHGYTNY